MRGFLIFLGLALVLGGGAVAGAQFAGVDLSMLDSVAGAKEFLLSPMALYVGGGTAGFGLLLIIIAAATGGKKKEEPAKADAVLSPAPVTARAPAPEPARTVVRPAEKPPQAPSPKPAPQPVAAAPQPKPQPAAAPKPTASAQPPEGAYDPLIASRTDPRLFNRKRVKDLVSINVK